MLDHVAYFESRFMLVMAPGSPVPDTNHRIVWLGQGVVTLGTGVVTPAVEHAGHYVDCLSGAIVAQSVVDWWLASARELVNAHPDWTAWQVSQAVDRPRINPTASGDRSL